MSNLVSFEISPVADELHLDHQGLTDLINARFPDHIVRLNLRFNHIRTLEGANFPKNLEELDLTANRLKDLSGVTFPDTLEFIDLAGNSATDFRFTHFPEGCGRINLWLTEDTGALTEGVYVSPRFIYNPILQEASRHTCTRAILRRYPLNPFSPGAWATRVSYLLGGVTWQMYDEALQGCGASDEALQGFGASDEALQGCLRDYNKKLKYPATKEGLQGNLGSLQMSFHDIQGAFYLSAERYRTAKVMYEYAILEQLEAEGRDDALLMEYVSLAGNDQVRISFNLDDVNPEVIVDHLAGPECAPFPDHLREVIESYFSHLTEVAVDFDAVTPEMLDGRAIYRFTTPRPEQ